jgi:hypothetical protein
MKCLRRWAMGFLFCKDNAIGKMYALVESLQKDSSENSLRN